MTHTVSRAALLAAGVYNIEEEVATYVRNLKTWLDHHRRVEKEKDLPLPEEPERKNFPEGAEGDEEFSKAFNARVTELNERHQAYPMEVIHPDLMKCVVTSQDANGVDIVVPDYEITEDLPTTEEKLRDKKDALLREANAREVKELNSAVPPGKVRANTLRHIQLNEKDMEYRKKLEDDFKSLPEEERIEKWSGYQDSLKDLSSHRSSDENKFLQEQEKLKKERHAVHARYAIIQSDIEDLTSDNIDQWKFPEA